MADPANGAARIPASTYRLQLRPDLDFRRAADLAVYLDRLGVTDLYVSPILEATRGSDHGYDVVDFTRLRADLGGEEGWRVLANALRERGLGLVVDFVPNHMGIEQAEANRWWWDVLENGTCSPYARFFDVDWTPVKPELHQKVLLPVLGDQYGRVLERGELRLDFVDGSFVVRYYDNAFPVNPRRAPNVLRLGLDALRADLGEDHPEMREFESILTALRNLPSILESDPERVAERQREKEVARERLARLVERSERLRRHIDECVQGVNGRSGDRASFDALHALLDQQAYRLAHWRTAFHEINYRRFFDVNGLASVRMEAPEVFDEAHALLMRLVSEGTLTGVRLDHVDGLYDPADYLRRLRASAAEAKGVVVAGEDGERAEPPPIWVVAEKILSGKEKLSRDWALHGTTGYDFLNDLNGLFLDRSNQRELHRFYARFTGQTERFVDVAYASKRTVSKTTLASERNILAHALNIISEGDRRSRDFTLDSLQDMLQEVVACFPVYRTYVVKGEPSEADTQVLSVAIARARGRNPEMDASIFEFLRDVMLGNAPEECSPEARVRRSEFAAKFQQYTGPVTAKGLEDTAFYRWIPLLSVNEVGGHPETFGRSVEEFHTANRERGSVWPHAMLCTATHDTKRGEDGRARLNVLSEIPAEWSRQVGLWARTNAASRTLLGETWAPDRNDEYLLYQALIAAWPSGEGAEAAEGVLARTTEYAMKAMREAKTHTSWIQQNASYEQSVQAFLESILLGKRAARFLETFLPFLRRVARLGAVGTLAQVLLKTIAPGVPDFYQGSELWDLSLVDPDNRRPVDFERRVRWLAELEPLLEAATPSEQRVEALRGLTETWEDGRLKLLVTAASLRLRKAERALFLDGEYVPLEVRGAHADHVVAAARRGGGRTVVAVAPRLCAHLAGGRWPLGAEAWGDTRIILPWSGAADEPLTDRWTGVVHRARGAAAEAPEGIAHLAVGDLLSVVPVALLSSGR